MQMHDSTGKFRGYALYAQGHRRPQTEAQRAGLIKARLAHVKPAGTRRITKRSKGTSYWVIKIEGQRRWQLEHRAIIEQELKRPLRRNEHVHHLDGNGLNNDDENLVLMSASAHTSMTSRARGGPQKTLVGKRHRCSICRLEHDWPA